MTLTKLDMLKKVALFLTKNFKKSCKCTNNNCIDFSSRAEKPNIEPSFTNKRNKWKDPYNLDKGISGYCCRISAYCGRSNLYSSWEPSITLKYSTTPLRTSDIANSLQALDDLDDFLKLIY